MKKLQFITISLLLIFTISSCGSGDRSSRDQVSEDLEPGEIPSGSVSYRINPETSEIAWMASKVTGQHNGTIDVEGGNVYLYEGSPVGGNVDINMESITVLDLTDPEMNAQLTGHLKSDDFFSVDSHPEANFEFLTFDELQEIDEDGNNYKVTGNLTIKDITHTIAFNANIMDHGNYIHTIADFDLDRTLWDIRFRSGKFFENLGDNLIHDNFTLELDVVADKVES